MTSNAAATASADIATRARLAKPAPAITVTNPATGEVVGQAVKHNARQVQALVKRARAAQAAWNALGFDGRARVLNEMRRRLVSQRDHVIEVLQSETGKTYEDANGDLLVVVAWLKFWADHAESYLADEPVRSFSPLLLGRKNFMTYRPRGVVGVIGPWNVPLSLTFGDAIPALAAGNTVVLKPSEVTPLSAVMAAEMWVESGGPADTCLVATGDGRAGAALVKHVDFIQFTGSVKTGQAVAKQAIDTLTPYSLELGGKDPMIVLADADIERAANAAIFHGFFNTGQVCMSAERVYVEEPVYDDFVRRVTEKVGKIRQGGPRGPGSVDVSAMIHPPQIDIVARHVDDAVTKGARVLVGGSSPSAGYYAPTVLVDVDHSMLCMTEETFGPTLPIMKVADADTAVALANDSVYGLTASVWTKNLGRGEQIARRIEAGTVTVNDSMTHLAGGELPMGGHKLSGIGARNGRDGIRKFCTRKLIQVNRIAPKRDLGWMPYSAKQTGRLGKVVELMYGRQPVAEKVHDAFDTVRGLNTGAQDDYEIPHQLPFSPDSVTWRILHEPVTFLGGSTALLLQVAHPLVAAGVEQHSEYEKDPWDRLWRTFHSMFKVGFSDPETSREYVNRIQRRHDAVRGKSDDGVEYSARDQELQLWVLTTLYDTSRLMYERTYGQLSARERTRGHDEFKISARAFGIADDLVPQTFDDYVAYFDRVVSEELLITDAALKVKRSATKISMPPVVGPPLGRLNEFLAAGLLPPKVRDDFAMSWTARDERRLARFFSLVRAGGLVTPGGLRALPVNYLAKRESPLGFGRH